ncbi:hypothetical protein GCM10010293_53040 [Streptomyces griseoflavus]|nr:hypothetical protein GCM10010293_53040 [Streptomyces griseoflavus]
MWVMRARRLDAYAPLPELDDVSVGIISDVADTTVGTFGDREETRPTRGGATSR